MNSYNNCWVNSVLQVLCGSAVAAYFWAVQACPSHVCHSLRKIHNQLQRKGTDLLVIPTDLKADCPLLLILAS